MLYSTYLGGDNDGGNEAPLAVAIDAVTGHAVMVGYTQSTSFPVTTDAIQPTNHGGVDAFLAEVNTSASGRTSLVYSSYLGGASSDEPHGVAIGPAGCWLVTGFTFSLDFPVTPGAFQTTFGGARDEFVFRQNR